MVFRILRSQVRIAQDHMLPIDYGNPLTLYLDLSIAPDNVGANTYNTAIAIGEKAALIIAEDLYRQKLSSRL